MPSKAPAATPLQIVIVLLVFTPLLGAWIMAKSRMAHAPLPYHMAALGDGNVVAGFRQQLYVIHADGSITQGAPLPKLSKSVGMAARNADSVFVYLDNDRKPDTEESLRRFARMHPQTRETTEGEGIYTCTVRQGECQLFSDAFVATGSARLQWDAARQQLIVADTPQHRLLVLNANGTLDSTVKGLRFPNGFWDESSRLLVADTNHHRVASIDLDAPGDPATVATIKPDTRHTWPTDVIRVASDYWVLACNSSLADCHLFDYDASWHSAHRLANSLNHIVSLVPFGDGALALDLDSHTLWRVDAAGNATHALWLPGMREAHATWRRWRGISVATKGLFVLALLAGFGFAWRQQQAAKGRTGPVAPSATATTKPVASANRQIWIAPTRITWRLVGMCAGIAVVFLMIGWAISLMTDHAHPLPVWFEWFTGLSLAGLLFITVGGAMLLKYVGATRLGVQGGQLLLSNPAGRHVAGNASQIRCARHMVVVIGDVIVPLNNSRNAMWQFWNKEQLAEYVNPLLDQAQKLRMRDVISMAWRLRFWPWITYQIGIALLLAGASLGLWLHFRHVF